MTTEPTQFPLCWPPGVQRFKGSRQAGTFKTSLAGALDNVTSSLMRFGSDSGIKVTDVIISSNVTLGHSKPVDAGIAVWFKWDGQQVCIPIDRYATPEANLQAIHHILEARRVELRHGTLSLVRASMQGFKALPAPVSCWNVLGLKPLATAEAVHAAFKERARQVHPDQGGDPKAMAELTEAREMALREIGA